MCFISSLIVDADDISAILLLITFLSFCHINEAFVQYCVPSDFWFLIPIFLMQPSGTIDLVISEKLLLTSVFKNFNTTTNYSQPWLLARTETTKYRFSGHNKERRRSSTRTERMAKKRWELCEKFSPTSICCETCRIISQKLFLRLNQARNVSTASLKQQQG